MTLPVIPGKAAVKELNKIVVNTNSDDDWQKLKNQGFTSLRYALLQAAKPQYRHEIVFESKETDSSNEQNLSYWTIQLQSPLHIFSGDIKVNQSLAQNVTLVPEWETGKTGLEYKDMTGLYVRETVNPVNVELNRINFANFHAKGGDAVKGSGGGGGLGGGGAIVLRGGELTITNSVFQKNKATGGIGATGVTGGRGTTATTFSSSIGSGMPTTSYSDAVAGKSGGGGGKPSIPYSPDLDRQNSNGGNGGANDVPISNLNGKKGNNAPSLVQAYVSRYQFPGTEIRKGWFTHGYGGAGGAGGGGANNNHRGGLFTSWQYGSPGNGGNGAIGGFGAGSGGGGGAGGVIVNSKKAVGGAGGIAPAFGTAGTKGGSSGNLPKTTSSVYFGGTTITSPGGNGAAGGRGGDGSALGGAILVLDGYSNSKLNLWNTDFIHNTSTAGSGAKTYNHIFQRGDSGNSTQINILQPTSDSVTNKITYRDKGGLAGDGTLLPVKTINDNNFFINPQSVPVEIQPQENLGNSPVYVGRSYITNPEVVKLRPISQTFENISGIAETTIINFDSAVSGRRSVNGDFSSLSDGIKDIWKDLYPDRKEQINSEFESAVIQSVLQTGMSLATGGFGIEFPDVTKWDKQSSLLKGNALGLAGSLISAYYDKEQKLKQNAANQEKLRGKLAQDLNPTLAPIDITSNRTTVRINNFTLGEDIIEIPNIGDDVSPKIGLLAGGAVTISLPNNDGKPNVIAEINLDPRSLNLLLQKGQAKSDYISDMFFRSTDRGGSWKLGKYSNQIPITSLIANFVSGPASTILNIDRGDSISSIRKSVRTFDGDDQVIGSQGYDQITTGNGMDIIYPKGGADIINAGDGADYVVLSDLQNPIEVNYNESTSLFELPASSTSGKQENKGSTNVATTLQNVEIVGVYGGSKVNYSNLPEPSEVNYWGARLGGGSQFIGSEYSDRVVLGLHENEYNSANLTKEIKVIDGGTNKEEGVVDTLEIDSPAGLDISIKQASNCGSVFIQQGNAIVNEVRNFDKLFFKGTDNSDEFKICPSSSSLSQMSYIVHGYSGQDKLMGGSEDDILYGGSHDDKLSGKGSHDVIDGGSGDDVLRGNIGNDTLHGGSGDDTIAGGSGDDIMKGQSGGDVFIISKGDDQIRGYDSINDSIQISPSMDNIIIHSHMDGSLVTNGDNVNTWLPNVNPSDINIL